MENKHRTAPKLLIKDKAKISTGTNARVFVFYKQPKLLMVSIETDILRANICCVTLLNGKTNCIRIVRKGICPISKRAGFYTTNPELFRHY